MRTEEKQLNLKENEKRGAEQLDKTKKKIN